MNAAPPSHVPPQQQQQQQQQQIQANLPAGVENVFVAYSVYGRPRVMMTLLPKPRRKLMAYAVFQLIFGPLIVILTSVAIALQHYYVAYGYASGVLFIVTGSLGVWASKSNNPCGIKAVFALTIQCTIWSAILAVVAAVLAGVYAENRTAATIAVEAVLSAIGLTGFIICLVVCVFFCKISCSVNCHACSGAGASCPPCGQQVIICGQQQQMPTGPTGPPPYSAAKNLPAGVHTGNPAAYEHQQQTYPPAYDNAAVDYPDKA